MAGVSGISIGGFDSTDPRALRMPFVVDCCASDVTDPLRGPVMEVLEPVRLKRPRGVLDGSWASSEVTVPLAGL